VYSRLAPDFLRASEDDLKTFSEIHSQFIGNSFWDVFYSISEAMMTRPANIPGTLEYARDPSPESDLSSSSNEDRDEEISRNLMNGILRVIFSHAGYSPIESQGFKYRVEPCASYHLRCYVADNNRNMRSQTMRIPLGTSSRIIAKNDGGLSLTRQGQYTGSGRYGTLPLLSVEVSISCNHQGHAFILFQAKRRHAGGIRRPAGEGESYSPDILGQEVAELLGQAMEHCEQLGGWRDQEAFVLTIHGTHLKLVAGHFSAKYLSYVNSPMIPDDEDLWVRRSRYYDLKTQSGRAGALKVCIGVFEYLGSGKAEIGLLEKLLE
jgi:hypothetical protein